MSPATPRFVRILQIVEENYGDSIHIKAIAETDEGGHVALPVIRYGTVAGVEFNRANAYDELFAKIYARASRADVEAAKLSSKVAGEQQTPHEPPPLDPFEVAQLAEGRTRIVTDPDHIERMAAMAKPARTEDETE